MNLIADMANIMREELREIGYKVNITNDHEVMICYFTICKRIIKATPRCVHEAKGLVVPSSRKTGYDTLKEKFEKGESVMPYLSKQIKGLKFQDKMLFDWDIHHFHLGAVIESNGFVKQNDEILYAIVDEKDVYFIDVLDHTHWSDKELLDKVLSNWPGLLESYRIDGQPEIDYSSKEVEQLRAINVNAILILSDGNGYIGRGMGITAAGTSSYATITANKMAHDLDDLERCVNERFKTNDDELYEFKLHRKPEGIYLVDNNHSMMYQVFDFQSLKNKITG